MTIGNNTTEPLQDHIDVNHWAAQMFAARTAQQPFPRVSDTQSDLNLTTAYAIQNAFVAQCINEGEKISGFKAALTAPAAQAAMGIDSPVVGVLFANGNWEQEQGKAAVTLKQIPKLILETELGFTLSQDVTKPLADADQLKQITATCHPMVELACLGFGDAAPTGPDMVAGNSASKCYLKGSAWDWRSHNLDTLEVSLTRDGELQHQTSSGSLMEGQWDALLWLVNCTVANGYKVEAGQILMTGSIGGLHPAKPGNHIANYGPAGELHLSVG